MVRLVSETRRHRKVAVGVSPRGTLSLLKITRSWAASRAAISSPLKNQALRPASAGPPPGDDPRPVD